MQNNLFSVDFGKNISGVTLKSRLLKRQIISALTKTPLLTVAELSAHLNVSTPTITKLINELVADGYIAEMGKIETAGGRRPASFALNPDAGFFLGVEVANGNLRFALCNMKGVIIDKSIVENAYEMSSNETIDVIASHIDKQIAGFGLTKDKILGQGLSLRGRVDSTGGHSYSFLNAGGGSLSQKMFEKTGTRTIVENDTRSVAYADYVVSGENKDEDRLFIYADRGVGVGIIIDGKLYYGKSGFAGEFGHIPFFDNQIICHCGKKGCLETETSGIALENAFIQSIKEGRSSILSHNIEQSGRVSYEQIVDAAIQGDVLSIELIGMVSDKLGRAISFLINIFNPHSVVIGGGMSRAGDFLLLPLRTSLGRYSLSLVNNDTSILLSTLDQTGGVEGAALLTRHHILCEPV